jgi:hypothetical protein
MVLYEPSNQTELLPHVKITNPLRERRKPKRVKYARDLRRIARARV